MKIGNITLQTASIPSFFALYIAVVCYLTIGQLIDSSQLTSFLNRTFAHQPFSHQQVLGSTDEQEEPRLLAQAGPGNQNNDSVHVVCPEGSQGVECEYYGNTGIQEAINLTGENHVVYIRNGRYSIHTTEITSKQGITLRGESRSGTIIEDNGFIIRDSDNISIKDLAITRDAGYHSGHTRGIIVENPNSNLVLSVSNVLIENYPIAISSVASIDVRDSVIKNTASRGIEISGNEGVFLDATIRDNTFENGNGGNHISVRYTNVRVENNVFLDMKKSTAMYLQLFSEFIIRDNTITNVGSGIYADSSSFGEIVNNEITGLVSNAIRLFNTGDVTLSNNILTTDGTDAVYVSDPFGSYVSYSNTCTPQDPDCNTTVQSPQSPSDDEQDQPEGEDGANRQICETLEGTYTQAVLNAYINQHHDGAFQCN